MTATINANHLKRYKDIALLLFKHRQAGFLAGGGTDDLLTNAVTVDQEAIKRDAESLATDLERMGPIFIKLGQVLSARTDLMPPEYIEALTKLQDKLEPIPFQEVEQLIESELGVRMSKAFLDFEPTPIGTASLGQVHRAALRDGRRVAVKVQRPGIRQQIAQDIEALGQIAGFADDHLSIAKRFRFGEIVDEFRRNLLRELDYRQEARNLVQIGANLEEFPRILIPSPIDDYTTSCVLTMDYMAGIKITEISSLKSLEMDGAGLADELCRAYLKQTLVDGIFHADPHAGNVFITEDHHIALVDLGMVGHLSPAMQDKMLKLLLAMSEGRPEDMAEVAINMGERTEDFDERLFRRRISALILPNQDAALEDIQVGRSLLAFTRETGEHGLIMPSELTMMGKMLLNLDQISRILDPKFNPNKAVRENAADILQRRYMQRLSPANVLSSMLEAQDLTEIPKRVNRILQSVADEEFTVRIKAVDEAVFMEGFQKVANRIATGLILAALIVGAAMLMNVPTSYRLMGYPGLAILCFLAAAGGGFWLVLTILLTDRNAKPQKR
jgi:predicted unusual protein kinase regulating ubiquinone biosynthesis (AarF/ABC1/UbiB family)